MNNLTIKQLAAKHNELLARLIELNVETKVAPVKRFATKKRVSNATTTLSPLLKPLKPKPTT